MRIFLNIIICIYFVCTNESNRPYGGHSKNKHEHDDPAYYKQIIIIMVFIKMYYSSELIVCGDGIRKDMLIWVAILTKLIN